MNTLNPYIDFGGKCREAMTFYKDIFQGDLTVQTFGDFGESMPEPMKNMVMHSELRAGSLVLHASDGRPDHPATVGDNVTLSLQMTDEAEQQRIFDGLAQGGKIDQKLEDAPWGARFGMLTDRFGLHWLLNCPKQQ